MPFKHSSCSKSSLPSSVNPVSRNDVLVENINSRDSKTSENMPLYPHSILKKVSSARKISPPAMVQDEPTIDYSTDDGEKEESDDVNPKSSLTQTTKAQKLSKNSVIDDSPLDRPIAKPGKQFNGYLTLRILCFFTSKTNGNLILLFLLVIISGTIADREHRKWTEKAIPFQNNPYTKESIERRLQRISGEANGGAINKSALGHDSDVEQCSNEISTKKDLVVNSMEPSKIDCGLKSYDPSLYRRDYYVNSNAKQQCSTLRNKGSAASTRSDGSSSNVSDDGNYSCSGGSSSSEDHPLSDISSPEPSRSTVLSSKKNNECKNLSQEVKV